MAASGYLAFHADKQISERRALLRSFESSARDAGTALSELRAGQQAYVAAGQGAAFWMPKVATLAEAASQDVDALRTTAQSTEARSALMDASSSVTEFSNVDKRARDYLKSNQSLMAADVIFTEGGETASAAAKQIDVAAMHEHEAFDRFEAAQKKAALYAIGGGAGIALLTLLLLAGSGASEPAETSALILRRMEDDAPAAPSAVAPAPAPMPRSQPHLRAAAAICTDFARVRDVADLRNILARAADALDASGLVVWLGTTTGGNLRPVAAHGYPQQLLDRMPSVPKSADNAAAAAYRTGSMQIVLARPGGQSGALVAPLLAPEGCIGSLTAEIKSGGESSDAVQFLAAIFAAQLATVLAASAQAEPADVTAKAASL